LDSKKFIWVTTVTVLDDIFPTLTCVYDPIRCANIFSTNEYQVSGTEFDLTATWDNCEIVSISNDQNSMSSLADHVFATGNTTVTWTVIDASNNTSTCTSTVTVNPLPVASIEASTADDFCNGVTLTAYSSTSEYSYLWSRGDATQSIFLNSAADAAGYYTVQVTDQNGCVSPIQAMYDYEPEDLTSSYTILGFKEVQLGDNTTVQSGSVGLTDVNRTIEIKKDVVVNSAGSFVKGDKIHEHYGSTILTKIYDPVTVELPTMYYNTTTAKITGKTKVKKNTSVTISSENINIDIEENANVTITGSVYGEIKIGKGSTVIFTSSSIDLENLKTEDSKSYKPSSVQFAQDAQVRVKEKVEIGKYTAVNPYNSNIVFYIGEEAKSKGHHDNDKDDDDDRRSKDNKGGKDKGDKDDGKDKDKDDKDDGKDKGDNDNDNNGHKGSLTVKGEGTSFNASAYVPNGQIHVHGHAYKQSTSAVIMTGQFIADKIHSHGKYVIWNWHSCDAFVIPPTINKAEKINIDAPIGEEAEFNVYPIPNNGLFTTSIKSTVEELYTISIYNSIGLLIFEKRDIEVVHGTTEESIDIQEVHAGMYYVVFWNDNHYFVKKMIITK